MQPPREQARHPTKTRQNRHMSSVRERRPLSPASTSDFRFSFARLKLGRLTWVNANRFLAG